MYGNPNVLCIVHECGLKNHQKQSEHVPQTFPGQLWYICTVPSARTPYKLKAYTIVRDKFYSFMHAQWTDS